MKRIVCKNYDELSRVAATYVARQIWEKPDTVLGLATGGTPIGLYANLAEMHRQNDLDFSKVVTFNLDEYYPIPKENRQSYDFFMWDNLFSHINISKENVHIPDGTAPDAELECAAYDKMLADIGGTDLQVLGIGVNGHIGFNEPADYLEFSTHKTSLTESTIAANARFFATPDEVPRHALTMGLGAIFSAKTILMLISGENKASVVKEMFSDRITPQNPASMLQLHPNVVVILDQAAAKLL